MFSNTTAYLVICCRVVAQAVERNLLLGHQLARALIHLGVVDADAAEDGERLEQDNVRLTKRCSLFLEKIGNLKAASRWGCGAYFLRSTLTIRVRIPPCLLFLFCKRAKTN